MDFLIGIGLGIYILGFLLVCFAEGMGGYNNRPAYISGLLWPWLLIVSFFKKS